MHKHRGVTLIELMTVLTIMVLVVLAGTTLGRGWIANAHIAKAEAMLLQSYQIARTAALKNAGGITGTDPLTSANKAVATLDVSASPVLTVTDNSTSPATTIWTGTIDSDTSVTLQDSSCGNQVSLDNMGLPTATGCLAYTISASGGTTASGSLR